MEFIRNKAQVFVKLDTANNIIAVDSSIFLQDTTGWVQIDEGYGDKYAHAQGNYFDKPITTEQGVYIYRLVDGGAVGKTIEEIAADIAAIPPEPIPDTVLLKAQVQALTDRNEFLEDCIAEMATIIYG